MPDKITAVKRENLYNLILADLSNGDYTAREISEHLYRSGYLPYPTREMVHPRLSVLEQKGSVEVVATKIDETTHKCVSVYRKCI